ncbi:hypothetical protein RhiirB3_394934 [Rhizophagus irregularis]|nr:hypothetical protein RhiirB3_394934 [Rhizophagus irregularis]
MRQEWKLRLLIYRFTDLHPMKCKGMPLATFYIIKQISIYGSLVDLYGARIGATFFLINLKKEILAGVEKEEVNEVKESPRVQSDDDVYFGEEVDHDSAPHPVEETNDDDCSHDNDSEEEMPDDDGYNRYGGYNEYGECDRGYYYRDGIHTKEKHPQ